MFAEGELTCDSFLGGRLRLFQPKDGYRAAMDPVLLAAAVPAAGGQSVLDLGCGVGAAALCLGARVSGLRLTGLEVQPAYAALARRNAAANGLGFDVVEGDVADLPAALRAVSFDHVIANPPYFPAGGGTPAGNAGREAALREATPLAVWLDSAIRRLRPGGVLTVIQAADRLPDLLAGLRAVGRIAALPILPRANRAAVRVVLSATKGGRAPFSLCPPFVLHKGSAHEGDWNSHTAEAEAVLRDAAALDLRCR